MSERHFEIFFDVMAIIAINDPERLPGIPLSGGKEKRLFPLGTT
jgi:hypothetical protein